MADQQQLDIEWLFPVPLFRTQLVEFEPNKEPLISFAKDLQRQDAGAKHSNVGGWHSRDIVDSFDSSPLNWVKQNIIASATRGISRARQVNAEIDLQLDSAWFMINQKHNWNSPHTHMPSQWSGILYLSVNEDNAGSNGGRLLFIDPIPLGPAFRNPINAHVQPSEGLLLIFPSYLTHMVEPHAGDEERISLSFNFRALQKK